VLWDGLIWLRIFEDACESGNEISGSMKRWEVRSGCTTDGLSSSAHLLVYVTHQ
jgi:hypothetical protein